MPKAVSYFLLKINSSTPKTHNLVYWASKLAKNQLKNNCWTKTRNLDQSAMVVYFSYKYNNFKSLCKLVIPGKQSLHFCTQLWHTQNHHIPVHWCIFPLLFHRWCQERYECYTEIYQILIHLLSLLFFTKNITLIIHDIQIQILLDNRDLRFIWVKI